MTAFALSTDNLKRPKLELDTLMGLAREYFRVLAERGGKIDEHGVRINVIGNIEMLPQDVQDMMRHTMEVTKHNTSLKLNICICYSSKEEIYEAARKCADKYEKRSEAGEEPEPLTEEEFDAELFGGFNCKPDILIRTSDEIRLSNFMLYQSDNAQISFVKNFWPDFSIWDMVRIVMEYQRTVNSRTPHPSID